MGTTIIRNGVADVIREVELPLSLFFNPDGTKVDASGGATEFDLILAVDSVLLRGSPANSGGTTPITSTAKMEWTIPADYVAAGSLVLRAHVQYVEGGTIDEKVIDLVAHELDDEGAPGSDLSSAPDVLTAAFADVDFTITAAGLVAGDKLRFVLSTQVGDSGGGNNFSEIGSVKMRYAAKGVR